MKYTLYILMILGIGLVSCEKEPDFSDIPYIEFESLDKDTIIGYQLPNPVEEPVVFTFYFEDGDGDLGVIEGSSEQTIFLVNEMVPDTLPYTFPEIPLEGGSPAISGTVDIDIEQIFCSPLGASWQDVTFGVFIRDRAGNQSNYITATPLILDCN